MIFPRVDTPGTWRPVSELGRWVVIIGCPQCGRDNHFRDIPDDGVVALTCPCGYEVAARLKGWNAHGGQVHDH